MEKTLGSEEHRVLIDFLVQQREKLGMTQSELAAEIGEYQSFVARLESGQRRLDVIEFLRLAKILKFDAKAVLGDLQKLGV